MYNTRVIDTNTGKVRWFVSDKLRQRFLLPFDLAVKHGMFKPVSRNMLSKLGYEECWNPAFSI